MRSITVTLFAALLLCLAPAAWAADQPLPLKTMLEGRADGLVDNSRFMPPAASSPAKAPFTGTLKLSESEMKVAPADFRSHEVMGKDPLFFPAAELSFFTVDDALVPASQEVLRYGAAPGGKSFWDIIVQPGKVWSEAADDGWNRGAFPFALVHSIEGETHNGVAMFLYKDKQVSKLHYQVLQQTSPFYIEDYFTAWGAADLTFDPTPPAGLEELTATFRAAAKALVPLKPWSELEAKVGADKVARFDTDIRPEEIVMDGLWYDGQFYLKSMPSPAGPLPYADWQRFGIWSVTKTMANGTAMLRLAQKYGPEVFDLKLTDYITELKGVKGWDDVNFGHALSMTTAMGTGTDEIKPNSINDGNVDDYYSNWYEAPTIADKIAAQAKDARRHPWKPGEYARYRDFDQFILGVAMDRFLKSKEGPQADIWGMMLEEVFKPIGIYYAPINRTLEAEGPGHPLMCFGYYPTVSDMVKIGLLYQNDGKIGDQQILSSEMLADLKVSDVKRGLPTGNPFHTYYHKTLWHGEYKTADGRTLYYPLMLGWGGNWVLLFPEKIIGIRMAKNWDDDPSASSSASLAEVAFGLAGIAKGK